MATLERLFGRPLPASYRAFLAEFGGLYLNDRAVSGLVGATADDASMGNTWFDTQALRKHGAPASLVVISPHEDGAYCLDLDRMRTDGECPVVNYELASRQHDKPVAIGFEDWLLRFYFYVED